MVKDGERSVDNLAQDYDTCLGRGTCAVHFCATLSDWFDVKTIENLWFTSTVLSFV